MAIAPPEPRLRHPVANMSVARGREVVCVRGEQSSLVDRDGNRYFDAAAGLGYCAIGYGRAEIAEAIRDQLLALPACSAFDVYTSDVTLALAERLAPMVPVDGPRLSTRGSRAEVRRIHDIDIEQPA